MTRTGTTRSGWCMAGPPGSIPRHRFCRASVCTCDCHEEVRQNGTPSD